MISEWIMLIGAMSFIVAYVGVSEYTKARQRKLDREYDRSIANDRRIHPNRKYYRWGKDE
jgi:hypothetical protein